MPLNKGGLTLGKPVLRSGRDAGLRMGPPGGDPAYAFTNAEAEALVARFTSEPDDVRKGHIDTLVGALKTAGVWSKMDCLYVLAAHDAQAAQRNWIADAYNLTPTSAPTFEADRGYTGNGTSAYLNSAFNPSSAPSPLYTLNSAHIGVWSRTEGSIAGYDIGGNWGRISVRNTNANLPRYTANDAGVRNVSGAATAVGYFLSSRTAAGAGFFKPSGAAAVTFTTAASNNNSEAMRVLAGSTSYSTRQIACAHWGGGLSQAEGAAIETALTTYLQAVGAA